jgi:hypothetical protein
MTSIAVMWQGLLTDRYAQGTGLTARHNPTNHGVAAPTRRFGFALPPATILAVACVFTGSGALTLRGAGPDGCFIRNRVGNRLVQPRAPATVAPL